jgi:hypothetical protein
MIFKTYSPFHMKWTIGSLGEFFSPLLDKVE